MTKLLIIGAGGLGREILAYAQTAWDRSAIAGFLDDASSASVDGFPILGRVAAANVGGCACVLAVGDPRVRRALHGRLGDVVAASVIHPTAWIAPSAVLGQGVVVAPFVFVGPGATVGDHAVLNTGAIVGHDARVGAYAVLSPQAALGGGARVGDGVFMGMQSAVVPGVSLGAGAKVAAGTVLARDAPASSLAAGDPVRMRVMFEPWDVA